MIHYILQILVLQLLFLMVYDLFLKKETFFNWNRIYLLVTPILSILLPSIKINLIQEHIPPEYMFQLPAVLIGDINSQYILLPEVVLANEGSFFEFFTLQFVWCVGMLLSLLIFCFKLYKIIKLRRSGNKTNISGNTIISLPNTNMAFSFFNTIYMGAELSETKKTNILLHEKIHVSQYHSLDLILFEILRIIFWFNPLVYIYQNRIAMLQEYIADAKAVSKTDKKEYYQDLLSQIFQTDKISFINTFFNHSLIKNRIVMLSKSKSKKIFQLKYLLLLPVVCSMLIYSSCSLEANAQNSLSNSSKSEIIKNIENLKDAIAKQGNMTDIEERELKTLLMLTSENGLKDPFFNDVVEHAEIPFGVIEKVPVYPGCEGLSQEETKKCFSQNISKFVATEFNMKVAEKNNLIGRQKIKVHFKIDRTGKIGDIKVNTKDPELKAEALRVASKLPQMTPGSHEGVDVGVIYELPIVFEIKE
ncbi:M56 family metallopeptidase [Aquimarina sp. AU474]|uniref:M56 family metallopeptidase n=1 Tax=Aquimarina sp. AU474 TaxID=2108529 RepID=UPI000D69BE91|nr:M56 family metallopeptidase [Aquimarina sp. AU474]